tara:strand:+ start:1406 stop:3103 length:1698 start_codon:yes stop_codon:yes gene_type:complete
MTDDKSNLLELSKKEANKWLNFNLSNSEIQQIKFLLKEENKDILIDSFYKKLEFGTGGMRGLIGIGTNRMNLFTVSLATQGLCNYLNKSQKKNKSAVIAYDSRKFSKKFAIQTAKIFSANNIKSYIFSNLRPTPQLSFAVRELNSSCGIVITASHNPKEYNGYKVYWKDGGQITFPHDQNIVNEVNKLDNFSKVNFDEKKGLICQIDKEMDNKYIKRIKKLSLQNNSLSDLKIIFTSLHGTGITQVPNVLKAFGFKNILIVKKQEKPDPEFSTVISPNPEERDALSLGIKELKKENGDILLATDPDSDRVGVAIKTNNEIKILNGNQLATLIIYYTLNKLNKNNLKKPPFIAKTIVTSPIIDKIAKHYDVACYSTLTGFKFIAELIKNNKKEKFIAGGEESYGYLVDDFVRDKDAIISSAVICEITNWAKSKGKSLDDILEDIYKLHGLFIEKLYTIKMDGINGLKKIHKIMEDYRTNPPYKIFNDDVIKIIDYMKIQKNSIIQSKSNVIQMISKNNFLMTLRPSGTEPKIKFYFSVNGINKKKNKFELYKLIDKEILKIKSKYE